MATNAPSQQTLLYRGIYEFDDPSGTLLAVRIPQNGSADLYAGTAVIVRPNQCALFLYKGQIAELMGPGTHLIATENYPILTKLANWKFGFQSPLRCDLWFFSKQLFTGRRWGTSTPVLMPMGPLGTIPLRSFGTYNISLRDPGYLYLKLVGGKLTFDITDVEELVQAEILRALPQAFSVLKDVRQMATQAVEVSRKLEEIVTPRLIPVGLDVRQINVLSILPSQEVLQALDEKMAMQVIGNQKDYLLYKAATSLDQLHGGHSDPMQVLMGLMMNKHLADGGAPAPVAAAPTAPALQPVTACPSCQKAVASGSNFCPHCGKGMKA